MNNEGISKVINVFDRFPGKIVNCHIIREHYESVVGKSSAEAFSLEPHKQSDMIGGKTECHRGVRYLLKVRDLKNGESRNGEYICAK